MKLKEIYARADATGCKQICRFMLDMRKAGLKYKMRHYRGRFFWEGPAVVVDNIQEVLSKTKVPCQWDNMAMSWIVYPKESLR